MPVEICIVCDALEHEVTDIFNADDQAELTFFACKATGDLIRLIQLKTEQIKNEG